LEFLVSLHVLDAVRFESALSSGMKDKVQVSGTKTADQVTNKVVYYVIYSFSWVHIRLFRDRAVKYVTVS
jgi:hypothetical protein